MSTTARLVKHQNSKLKVTLLMRNAEVILANLLGRHIALQTPFYSEFKKLAKEKRRQGQ